MEFRTILAPVRWGLLVVAFFSGPVWGQDSTGNERDASPPNQDSSSDPAAAKSGTSQQDLVQQLGASAFDERERAAKVLLDQGLAARQALLDGLKSPDLEVRMRAYQLLQRIFLLDFESQLKDFVNGTADADPPAGWRAFSQIVGDTAAIRSMYADMFRSESGVLIAAATKTGNWQDVVDSRVETIYRQAVGSGQLPRLLTDETLATILFVTAVDGVDSLALSRAYSTLSTGEAESRFESSVNPSLLERLRSNWVRQVAQGDYVQYALQVCLRYDMADAGRQIACEQLETPSARSRSILPYAGFVLARFGTEADTKYLESHLDDDTQCHAWHNAALKNGVIEIQVRDVMLGLVLHMKGLDLEKFGYKHLRPNEQSVYAVYSLCFVEDAERKVAFQKWEAWKKEQSEMPDAAADPAGKQDAAADGG